MNSSQSGYLEKNHVSQGESADEEDYSEEENKLEIDLLVPQVSVQQKRVEAATFSNSNAEKAASHDQLAQAEIQNPFASAFMQNAESLTQYNATQCNATRRNAKQRDAPNGFMVDVTKNKNETNETKLEVEKRKAKLEEKKERNDRFMSALLKQEEMKPENLDEESPILALQK